MLSPTRNGEKMCRLKCESAIGSEERFDKEQYTEVVGGAQCTAHKCSECTLCCALHSKVLIRGTRSYLVRELLCALAQNMLGMECRSYAMWDYFSS